MLEEVCTPFEQVLSTSVAPMGFSAAELQGMRFPPIKYVVPGYIVEGLTLWAGRPKIGKSWLLLHTAIAVAQGGYTLGEALCQEGDVFYAALEDNKRRLQSRMTKLLGLQPWPGRLRFKTEMPRLREGGLDVIRRWIEEGEQPRLVIIDTLARVREPKATDQSSYEADYAAVSELQGLAGEHGIAVILVHHQRKMGADDPVDTVSGTTGLTGAVDTIVVLSREPQGATLYARGRDIPEIEKAISFDKDSCIWRVEGDATEVRRSDERSAIIAALAEAPQPMSPLELTEVTGIRRANVRQLLGRMAKTGEVERHGHGKYRHSQPPCHSCHSVTDLGEEGGM